MQGRKEGERKGREGEREKWREERRKAKGRVMIKMEACRIWRQDLALLHFDQELSFRCFCPETVDPGMTQNDAIHYFWLPTLGFRNWVSDEQRTVLSLIEYPCVWSQAAGPWDVLTLCWMCSQPALIAPTILGTNCLWSVSSPRL